LKLLNKVCLVTGGSSGIGENIARAYAKEGAKVIITYNRNFKSAKKIAKDISGECYKLEVRKLSSVSKTFNSIIKKYKKIDVLVNNAGVNKTNDFDKLSEKDWDFVLDVNLKGVFFCCQQASKIMKSGSKIINIGSISGEYGGPRTPSYAAAKAGVMSLTHCLARFLGKKNICVNCISPGVIENEFAKKTVTPAVKKVLKKSLLLDRLGTMSDISGLAILLASDESNYITAQTISVNGGAWVR
jgi:NAD(P)-dependent dehydrogenase (short-subunit alcohol dehydrogenase family)